jgi:hypothetical protein
MHILSFVETLLKVKTIFHFYEQTPPAVEGQKQASATPSDTRLQQCRNPTNNLPPPQISSKI